jgi:hypothetical protein
VCARRPLEESLGGEEVMVSGPLAAMMANK